MLHLQILLDFWFFFCKSLIIILFLVCILLQKIKRGRKPDGMCLVVGSCAHGFKENSSSDVIYSSSSVTKVADSNVQLFWEVNKSGVFPIVHNSHNDKGFNISLLIVAWTLKAFPAGSGPLDRTTYMFTYTEPQSTSPSLEDLLEEYWKLMPKYQVSFHFMSHLSLSFFLSKFLFLMSFGAGSLSWWIGNTESCIRNLSYIPK